jgi:hypothetical protein
MNGHRHNGDLTSALIEDRVSFTGVWDSGQQRIETGIDGSE